MRVIVRTPAELVAEYDLPDLDDSASDAEDETGKQHGAHCALDGTATKAKGPR